MSELAYALRTTDKNGVAHGGFQWPLEVGAVVTARDWNAKAACGNGLHGLLDGVGDYGLLSNNHDALWWVVEVERDKCVWIDGNKVKFPSCKVVYFGDMARAMLLVSNAWIKLALAQKPDGENIQSASGHSSQLAASGYYSRLAASGHSSQLAASGYYSRLAASGDSSQLAASGHSSRLAASGYYSRLAASGDSSQLAASGYYSQLAASGYYSRLAASGDSSQLAASGAKSIAVSAAPDCSASAGPDGCIALAYWDNEAKRYRMVVGYVGEDGIEANVVYVVRDGKLTPKEAA